MMYLAEAKLWNLVKKQYRYKLKAYMGLFFSLLAVQILGVLFSLGGFGGSNTHTGDLAISVKTYSGEIIIIFTFLWAFITSITLTTKEYRNADFTFISNRLSSNLSNIGLLLTLCIAGGISAILSGILLRVVVYFFISPVVVMSQLTTSEILVGMTAATFYLMFISSIGYFSGMLAQSNKVFVIILPTLFFGIFIANARIYGTDSIFIKALEFFIHESSLTLFSIKVLVTVIILVGSVVLLSDRMEVSK